MQSEKSQDTFRGNDLSRTHLTALFSKLSAIVSVSLVWLESSCTPQLFRFVVCGGRDGYALQAKAHQQLRGSNSRRTACGPHY
jgi:hypothetical protein